MADPVVDVFENGTVRLGSKVVCDGFAEGYPSVALRAYALILKD